MAHTKAKGSTKLGRESESKRLGVKRTHNQLVFPGEILIRQRGTKYHPGKNVRRGGDDTLYAVIKGYVEFKTAQRVAFNGKKKHIKLVSVFPEKITKKEEVKKESKPKATKKPVTKKTTQKKK